ncbi:MAG: hypothetical protein ABJG68_01300 [Crocinitomicaceae bacterium]
MKKVIVKCAALLFLVSCGGEVAEEVTNEVEDVVDDVVEQIEEPEVLNSYLLESKNVGIFSIGQEVPNLPDELKMRQFLETEQTEEGPGEELTHNVIFNQLEDVVELIMDHQSDEEHHEKKIEEMWVLSPYYETSEEIGVGSTIEEFQAAYPDAEVWYTYVSDRYVVETPTLVDVQFILNPTDCIKTPSMNTDQNMMKFEHFAEGAKIQKVRVY